MKGNLMDNYELIYKLQNEINEPKILGPDNNNINFIEELFNCKIMLNYSELFLLLDNIDQKENLIKMFTFLEKLLHEGINFNSRDLIVIKKAIVDNKEEQLMNLYLKKENASKLDEVLAKEKYQSLKNEIWTIKDDIISCSIIFFSPSIDSSIKYGV